MGTGASKKTPEAVHEVVEVTERFMTEEVKHVGKNVAAEGKENAAEAEQRRLQVEETETQRVRNHLTQLTQQVRGLEASESKRCVAETDSWLKCVREQGDCSNYVKLLAQCANKHV
jgi:hypothetical protein